MTYNVEHESEAAVAEATGDKYLTFFLAQEEFGLEILKVQEIIGIMTITPVPRTPEFVKGVVNLRGKIIPVVDLRQKFGMPTVGYTEETCIIVVQVSTETDAVTMGVVVDKVSEVVDITAREIEDTPDFGIEIDTRFILGIGKVADKVVIILDVDKVLSNREKGLIEQVTEEQGDSA